jgi:hypothetical protein
MEGKIEVLNLAGKLLFNKNGGNLFEEIFLQVIKRLFSKYNRDSWLNQ